MTIRIPVCDVTRFAYCDCDPIWAGALLLGYTSQENDCGGSHFLEWRNGPGLQDSDVSENYYLPGDLEAQIEAFAAQGGPSRGAGRTTAQ